MHTECCGTNEHLESIKTTTHKSSSDGRTAVKWGGGSVDNYKTKQNTTKRCSSCPTVSGCSPSPSEPSRPGLSPSWWGCVSSAWLPWCAWSPPSPRCQRPSPSASAPVYASRPWPSCKTPGHSGWGSSPTCDGEFTGMVGAMNTVSSPEQLLLPGSVVGAEGFELGLPLLQLRQDLVLRVPSLSRSLLWIQQPLGDQLLLDPSLQGTRVRNAEVSNVTPRLHTWRDKWSSKLK